MFAMLPRRVMHVSSVIGGVGGRQTAAVARRCISSMPKNEESTQQQQQQQQQQRDMHSTARNEQADAATVVMAEQQQQVQQKTTLVSSSDLASRFTTTAEVTVSKIFPAGFGWQSSSVLAENHLGYAPDTMAFALTTGAGDAVGVLGGHMAYYRLKKALLQDKSIDMTKELHTGIHLGSAAFCSGTAWQPLVDVLQGANLSFTQVFAGTWIGCGTAFYLGLRVGRVLLSGMLEHVEEATYANSKNDASLSVAIGGATGFFVGTDTGYLPHQNFLIDVVGINDDVSTLAASAIAGSSTSLGFVAAQSGLNVILPAKKLWCD